MSDFEHATQPYTRPPMTRGVDPQRMNWLWQLILQATDLDPATVRAALNATGVGATDTRVASWQAAPGDENYFPLTIAELERNLRALVAMKAKPAESSDSQASAGATHDQE